MTELQRDKLEILSVDRHTIEAIRSLFNDEIDKIKPKVLETDDNNLIGEKYRSHTVARGVLEKVLNDIEAYNKQKVVNKQFNKGI